MTQRILHIAGSLEVGGAVKQLGYLARRLPAKFESHVVALRASAGAVALLGTAGVEPKVIGWRGALDAIGAWRFWREIRRLKPDIVHIWPGESGCWPIRVSMGTVKRVVSVKDGRSDDSQGGKRWIASGADRVVVNSATMREHCVANGIAAAKVRMIADGVCPIERDVVARQELLAEWRLPSDAQVIAFMGALVKRKRLKELIWAIDQLKAVGTKACLLIIGEGPLRNRLERYARLNRVEDRVRFLGFRADISRLLSQVDVVWQAEAREGQSNAILEAMSAGIPVVVADVAENRELVVAGETGYLAPVSERAGFARCTLPLLEDAELAAKLGAEGRRRVQESHRVERMVAAYAELYESISAS